MPASQGSSCASCQNLRQELTEVILAAHEDRCQGSVRFSLCEGVPCVIVLNVSVPCRLKARLMIMNFIL